MGVERLGREDLIGTGWEETHSLCFREFWLPLCQGGCGRQWNKLMQLVERIEEPDYSSIGRVWAKLCEGGGAHTRRPEECQEETQEHKQTKQHGETKAKVKRERRRS